MSLTELTSEEEALFAQMRSDDPTSTHVLREVIYGSLPLFEISNTESGDTIQAFVDGRIVTTSRSGEISLRIKSRIRLLDAMVSVRKDEFEAVVPDMSPPIGIIDGDVIEGEL